MTDRCELGMFYGCCVGTKGQDTETLRKATVRAVDYNGDEFNICEGCNSVHFNEEYGFNFVNKEWSEMELVAEQRSLEKLWNEVEN